MPGFPQLPCPITPGFALGFDLVNIGVDPLIASQAFPPPGPPPGPPATVNITATFRAAGWVYLLLRNLPGGFPFQVQFTAESVGPGPEVVLGVQTLNLNAGFVPSGACAGAFDYTIALNVPPPPPGPPGPGITYRVAGNVSFPNPWMPGAAFADGPMIRSI